MDDLLTWTVVAKLSVLALVLAVLYLFVKEMQQ